ncbi:MAG: glycosyltransferase family 2 protein [Vicinamibacterales bacterium]
MSRTISAIVPTIGRIPSLATLLESLAAQTRRPDEIVVADGSDGPGVRELVGATRWQEAGLHVRYLQVTPPNAVRQRKGAIAASTGSLLLMLDDDVVPEPGCVAALADCLESHGAVAVGADFSNQDWPPPTMLWRWYLKLRYGISAGEWQGRVIGPLLRFGYDPLPPEPVPMEWLGSGHTLMRRDAYERAGGFSDFFLHRSTVNEDVDLGLKLGRIGRMFLCPAARMAHMQEPGGRASVTMVAEDDLFNRYSILRHTQGRSRVSASSLAVTFFVVETISGVFALVRTLSGNDFSLRLAGRIRALIRIAAS